LEPRGLTREVVEQTNRGIEQLSTFRGPEDVDGRNACGRASNDRPGARSGSSRLVVGLMHHNSYLAVYLAGRVPCDTNGPVGNSMAFLLQFCTRQADRKERSMATMTDTEKSITTDREKLIADLNGDLSREYQAIIAYVIYSQTIKGAAYMAIATELESHAKEELNHALTISKQIDYLGGTPTAEPKPVKISDNAEDMLRFDLDNETETVRHYRQRVRQCEALGEFAMAEEIL